MEAGKRYQIPLSWVYVVNKLPGFRKFKKFKLIPLQEKEMF